MTYRCSGCGWTFTLGTTHDRPPAWCGKCGGNFREDDWAGAAKSAAQIVNAVLMPAADRAAGGSWAEPHAGVGAPLAGPAPALHPPAPIPPAAELGLSILKGVTALLLVSAALLAGRTWTFLQTAKRTEGTVTHVEAYRGSKGRVRVVSTVGYTLDGRQYTCTAGEHAVGETVPLVYAPEEPGGAIEDTPGRVWQWPLITGIPGVVLLLLVVFASHNLAQRRRAFDRYYAEMAG